METTVFETALGAFGIGWTDAGIARLQLPGLDAAGLAVRINRGGARPGEPTRAIEAVINQIEDYADGEAVDFSDAPIDLNGVTEFNRRAYTLLLRIGWGGRTDSGALGRGMG